MSTGRTPGIFPVAHDTRRESRRRLVVGLSGLMVMLLLVLLAGYLTGAARQEAETAKAQAEAAGVANPGSGDATLPSPTEPLGDVPLVTDTPGNAPSSAVAPSTVPVVPDGEGSVVVPDLQPDPQLEAAKRRQ